MDPPQSYSNLIFLEDQCRDVNEHNVSYRCEFIQETASCKDHDGYLDYLQFMYCTFEHEYIAAAVTITVIWLLVLFISLGVTADDFLCPALVVISKTLRLSQNIAGVTFLAFGNGAPDIFSSLAGIEQARSDLVIGELFGAGIFVTTVVAGTICITTSFKIMERPFLRDIIFYIFATYWAFYIFYSHQIQLQFAAGFVALYGVYILVVIVSRIIYQRKKNRDEAGGDGALPSTADTSVTSVFTEDGGGTSPPPSPIKGETSGAASSKAPETGNPITYGTSSTPAPKHPNITISISPPPEGNRKFSNSTGIEVSQKILFKGAKALDDPEAEGVVLRRFSFRHSLAMPRRRTLSTHKKEIDNPTSTAKASSLHPPTNPNLDAYSVRIEEAVKDQEENSKKKPPFLQQWSTTSMMSLISKGPNDRITPWKDFIFSLCPIELSNWSSRKWYSRVIELIKAPIYFMLAFTTPVVDQEADQHNWCKYLNVLHCLTGPLFICFSSHKGFVLLGGVFPIWALVLIVSVLLATIVFFTSIVDRPPPYHSAFAYLGFGVSVMWIYGLAHEIVSLLKAIGVVFDLSDTILGLTVLAWGNSIGDFISNTSVARQGFPRMGISACFGGPLLNLLLGIGIPYTVSLVKSGSPLELKYTTLVTVLYAALAISLVSTLVCMTLLKFNVKRFYGIYLIVLYLVFLSVAVMVETGVIGSNT